MIEFSLQKKTLTGIGTISEPLIPVTIIGPSRSVDLFMLLDSGADISLLPYSVGEIIGLPPSMEKRREICGIGEGSVPYILSTVTLEIGDYTVPLRIGWVMIEEVPLIINLKGVSVFVNKMRIIISVFI